MTRSTTRRFGWGALTGAVLSLFVTVGAGSAPVGAFPTTPNPQVVLDHTVRTSPFVGSTVSIHDHEGSAYVPSDDSLWLADDNGRTIYEVNPITGALKRTIGDGAFVAAPRFGGGPQAGYWSDRDLESMSYDATNDTLYAFSGNCCKPEVLPTVFRLQRDLQGKFQIQSYQPLAVGSDFTGSAWNPGDGKLYVGIGLNLRTYDYATNTTGATFQVPNLAHITGLSFSDDGKDLWVTNATTKVTRVDWATKTIVPGWSFDLSSFGVKDARAVEIIRDQLWISDGYDFRDGDPLDHALFVFNVTSAPADYNLVRNSGFEQNTTGWNNNATAGVTLEQAPVAHSGSYSAKLTNTTATSKTMTLNDASPNWVPTTAAGTYTAHAWVRSDTGTAKAYVRIREYQGSTLTSLASSYVVLSSTWQLVTVSLSPQAAGSSSLDLNVYVSGAPAGTNLYVDDVVLNLS